MSRQEAREAAMKCDWVCGDEDGLVWARECADAASDVWEKDLKLLVTVLKEIGSYCYTTHLNQHTSILVFDVKSDWLVDVKLPRADAERVEELLTK